MNLRRKWVNGALFGLLVGFCLLPARADYMPDPRYTQATELLGESRFVKAREIAESMLGGESEIVRSPIDSRAGSSFWRRQPREGGLLLAKIPQNDPFELFRAQYGGRSVELLWRRFVGFKAGRHGP